MATDRYGQGITIPALTDAPNIATVGASMEVIVGKTVLDFASETARNATLTSPTPGQVAFLLDKHWLTYWDGSSWVVIAGGTQSWTTPTLASGYSANGNSNGTPQYRVVNLFGEQVVMWKGGLNVTYQSGSPVNDGNFLNAALPSAARPTALRTVTAACSAVSSESLSVKIDFTSAGITHIVTESGVTPPWVSLNNIMYSI